VTINKIFTHSKISECWNFWGAF